MAQDNQVITSQVKVTSGTKALVTGGTYTCSTADDGGAVNVAQNCTVTGATVSFVNNTLTKSNKKGGAISTTKARSR